MNFNWRRILILIGFIAGVILLGYLLYFFFLKPSPPSLPPTNANINGGGALPPTGANVNIPVGVTPGLLPPGANIGIPTAPLAPAPVAPTISPVANGQLTEITPLTTAATIGSALAADGSGLVYYDRNAGLIYQMTSDGQIKPLSDQVFFQVDNITWAPNRQKAVLEYPDGANVVYDFATKKPVTLPTHWKEFDFSPDGGQIVFKSMGASAENRWLAVAQPDGSGARKIEALGDKDRTVYVAWSPNNQIIATFSEDRNFDQQNLYFVGLEGENFKSTTIEGRDFRGLWSTQGDKLLYSVYNSESGLRPTLWLVTAQGETIGQSRRNLKLETWADKCSFSDNNTVYCAVPRNLPEGAGLFAKDFDNSPTDIYKIDLKTGFKSRVAIPENDPNIGQIIISQDGRYLYFTNRNDGKLYKIRLL